MLSTNLKTLVVNKAFERFSTNSLAYCSNLTKIVYYGDKNKKYICILLPKLYLRISLISNSPLQYAFL